MGVGVYHLGVLDRRAVDAKTRWLVCGVHQSALHDRAEQYRQKFGCWPTNVQELVEAHFLPEFSEIYICPSQVSVPLRTNYEGLTWVDQNQTGLVAYYASSPYRFQVESNKFSVTCIFDTEHSR